MPDKKWSLFDAATTIGTSDLIAIVQSGVNKKATGTVLRDQIGWTRSGTDVVLQTTTDQVGIGTASPSSTLHVSGIEGLLAEGTVTSGTAQSLGAGTRMQWYPKKAAFRAGHVDGTTWDDANIGDYSTATGKDTTASGVNSTAIGLSTTASANYAIALGRSTTASGQHSIAMGYGSESTGYAATATGFYTEATGSYSFSAGRRAIANHDGTFVWGDSTDADFTSTTTNQFLIRAGGGVGIGTASPAASLSVDQTSTTGALPVLELTQLDISEEMILFDTTIGTGNAIEAVGAKALTTTHFIKVTLPGALTRYIPAGTIA